MPELLTPLIAAERTATLVVNGELTDNFGTSDLLGERTIDEVPQGLVLQEGALFGS